MTEPDVIVFSDLDGTLLDHETYSFEPARPALEQLASRAIPLVLASSKTAAEMAGIRAQTGFGHCPAIVENGAGILAPEGSGSGSEDRYEELRQTLDAIPAQLRERFSGFGDMGLPGIMEATGLDEEGARLAADRRFSEPGLFDGPAAEEAAFLEALSARGVTARRGGRFLTLSFGADKAARMQAIVDMLTPGGRAHIVALGDAPNDIAMLEAADTAVVVANPAHPSLAAIAGENGHRRVIRTELPGPAGWNTAMLAILNSIGSAPSAED